MGRYLKRTQPCFAVCVPQGAQSGGVHSGFETVLLDYQQNIFSWFGGLLSFPLKHPFSTVSLPRKACLRPELRPYISL
jgi:hypothetical protein